MIWAGWALSVLAALFLLMDAVMKLIGAEVAVKATLDLGFTPSVVPWLGGILLVCTMLYLMPATSVLGAVLLAAYLGGTVAVHLQRGSPVASHVLFGVYLGLFAWGGLLLRNPLLRSLLPLVRG